MADIIRSGEDVIFSEFGPPELPPESPPPTEPPSPGDTEAEKPDFTSDQTPEEREQELRDAVSLSERVDAGEVESDFPEEEFGDDYWKSIDDIKAKLGLIEQAREVEQSYVEAEMDIPEQDQATLAQMRSLALSSSSPYITVSDDTYSVDIATALKAGKTPAEIESWGVEASDIRSTQVRSAAEEELRPYGTDYIKAVREGHIEAVRVLFGDTAEGRLAVLDIQKAEATGGSREKALAVLQSEGLITDADTLDLLGAVKAEIDPSVLRTAGFIVRQEDYNQLKNRERILLSLPPLVISVIQNEESLNLLNAGKAFDEGKLSVDDLRAVGYDVSEGVLTDWARLGNALDKVKVEIRGVRSSPALGVAVPTVTPSFNYVDAVRQGLLSRDDLVTLGFDSSDADMIVKTAEIETKLEPYRKTRIDFINPQAPESDYTDVGQALLDEAITKADLESLGYSSEELDRAKVFAEQGLKVYIPVYGTIVTWGVSTPVERALSAGGDVLLIVPTVGWLGKVGSTALKASEVAIAAGIKPQVGIVGRAVAAAKTGLVATEQLIAAPVTFPIQLARSPKAALKGLAEVTAFPFAHPVETAKGIAAMTTGRAFLGEPKTLQAVKLLFQKAAIPEAAIAIPTQGTGVQRVFTNSGLTDSEALEATRLMQITLSDMIASGTKIPKTLEIPVYEGDVLKFTIRYPTTRAMRELGVAAHASPFAERVLAGSAEPVGEGKIYFSTAMSPEWTGVTARGYTSPEAIELGRGGAVIKEMRINRMFNPVDNVYKHSVEIEMTVPKGTQIVTGREPVLEVLKAQGNVRVFPSVVMERTDPKTIVEAIRASVGKVFKYRPLRFTEVQSLPRRSAAEVEAYVRANDMMVGGSASERTWTDTVKLPEDIDLISLRNNAESDAKALARIIEQTAAVKTRVKGPEDVGKEVWRIERLDTKSGKWEQVTDVLDYNVHKTYNPDILNREPVIVEGIKVEHPLEQAERIVAKLTEYPVRLERHRGHPKRLAWMAEKLLDTPGGEVTTPQVQTLRNIATRIDYAGLTASQRFQLKVGGVLDSIRDSISPRKVEIILADGRKLKVSENVTQRIVDTLAREFPGKRLNEIPPQRVAELMESEEGRLLRDTLTQLAKEGKLRARLNEFAGDDPLLKGLTDEMESTVLYALRQEGSLTRVNISALLSAGLLAKGSYDKYIELEREVGGSPEVSMATMAAETPRVETARPIETSRVAPTTSIRSSRIVTPATAIAQIAVEEEPLEETVARKPLTEETTPKEAVPEEAVLPERASGIPRAPFATEPASVLTPVRILPEETPIPRVPRRVPDPERVPERPIKTTRTDLPGLDAGVEEEGTIKIPQGSIAWRQGAPWGVQQIKYVAPPWEGVKPESLLGEVPQGWIDKGRTPAETIQIIGTPKSSLPDSVSIDLGVVDAFIQREGDVLTIDFQGHGLRTDVGQRLASPVKGMSVSSISKDSPRKAKPVTPAITSVASWWDA